MGIAGLAVAVSLWSRRPAEAACELVKATHSAGPRPRPRKSSQALTLQSAYRAETAKRMELRHAVRP